MTPLIDLRNLWKPLTADIQNSLVTFITQHPHTHVCTVGFQGDGFHGIASMHADTPEHSAAFVAEWHKNGPAWYGEDEKGCFCNNCADFLYCIGEYSLPGYPDLYQIDVNSPVDYITLEGTTERAEPDEGDEGMNRVVFPFLKTVVSSFQPFAQLSRASPFRVGIQMHDSLLKEFWIVEFDKSGS